MSVSVSVCQCVIVRLCECVSLCEIVYESVDDSEFESLW